MTRIPIKMESSRGQILRRVGWLVLIWACSVTALGVVAFGMRLVMRFFGMVG